MRKIVTLIIVLSTLLTFCKKKKTTEVKEEEKPVFNKQALVQNYADNLILPAYNSFSVSLDSLIAAYNSFKVSANSADFAILKQKLHNSCLAYQRISLYEFGPAEQELVRSNFNVFPTDTVQIKTNFASGLYDLEAASNLDAKGFPALDYLIYDLNKSETQVIASFTASANKKKYVSDLLANMKTKTSNIISVWNNSYKNQFINSMGTDVGSSIGFLINQINFELDYLKNAKIGIPLGKKSLGIAIPEKCEAFYGKQSLQYAIETLQLIESVYLGRSVAGLNSVGFDDYLDHLNIMRDNVSLNTAIQNQFIATKAKLNALAQNTLSDLVKTNPALIDPAYNDLLKLLVLLKTDLPSNLGVIITYQDGDGD